MWPLTGIISGYRTVGYFPPLEACMLPSGTVKPSSLEGGFHVTFSSGPVSEVHDIFSTRDLSSTCDWCGLLLFYVCFLDDLWLLGVGVDSIVGPDGQISFKLYMYIHTLPSMGCSYF